MNSEEKMVGPCIINRQLLKYEKLTSCLLKLDPLLTVNFHIKMLAYTFAIVHYLPWDIFNIEKKSSITNY